MIKFREILFEKVLGPVILLIFTPGLTLIGAKISTGHWLGWLQKIPGWFFFAFTGIVIIWLVMSRVLYLRHKNLPDTSCYGFPLGPYRKIGEISYRNVRWIAEAPVDDASYLMISTPPVCPNCNTELEEHETFWGKYKWLCIKCDFQTKSNLSIEHEAVRVEKLFRSELKARSGE